MDELQHVGGEEDVGVDGQRVVVLVGDENELLVQQLAVVGREGVEHSEQLEQQRL